MKKMIVMILLLLALPLTGLYLYSYRWNILHPNKSHRINDRTMIYHVPKKLSPHPKLIIIYHGSKLKPFLMQTFTGHEFDLFADQSQDAIIVYPEGYKLNWNDCRRESPFPAKKLNIDDVTFTRQIIQYFKEQYQIDPTQVYAVGFSNGGQMAFKLAANIPELFAGFATIGATLPVPENNTCTGAQAPVSMMVIHGQQDSIVPYNGGEVTLDGESFGRSESAATTAEYWRAASHAELTDTQASSNIIQKNYYSPQTQKHVSFVSIKNGGHNIPNRNFRIPISKLGHMSNDIDVPAVIWDFFFKLPHGTGNRKEISH